MDSRQADMVLHISCELPISCKFPNRINNNYSSTCLDQITKTLEIGAQKLGYKFVRYSYWVKNILRENTESNSFGVNISNFPEKWESYYNQQGLYHYDPVVRIIQNNISKKHLAYGTWSDAYVWAMQHPLGDTPEQEKEYIKHITQLISSSQEHGLISGYYYSWGDDVRQIVLSLASHVSSVDSNTNANNMFINALHSMVILTNQSILMTQGCSRCNKSVRVDGSAPIKLSAAELKVLNLYYKHRNATQKQIAAQCERSIDTVNHHLRSIRQKLNSHGASGHALAAYAAELNLL